MEHCSAPESIRKKGRSYRSGAEYFNIPRTLDLLANTENIKRE